MKNTQQLKKLCRLLEQSKNHEAAVCLSHVDKEEVRISSGVTLETLHAYNTYKMRYTMQEEGILSGSYNGYKNLLRHLAQEEDTEILCFVIDIEQTKRIVFTTVAVNRLIGILTSRSAEAENIA